MICLDFRYVLSIINQYCANFIAIYVVAVVQILRYICDKLYYDLIYTKDLSKFVDYTNANWSNVINKQ